MGLVGKGGDPGKADPLEAFMFLAAPASGFPLILPLKSDVVGDANAGTAP